jgi:hypothetical protein
MELFQNQDFILKLFLRHTDRKALKMRFGIWHEPINLIAQRTGLLAARRSIPARPAACRHSAAG